MPPCTKKGWAKINLGADCYDSILRKTTKTERHKYQNDQFITITNASHECDIHIDVMLVCALQQNAHTAHIWFIIPI